MTISSMLATKIISSDGKKLKSIWSESTVENRVSPSTWTDVWIVSPSSWTDVLLNVSLFSSTDDQASAFSQILSVQTLFLDGIQPVIPIAMAGDISF
jgi:hypothetical protein